MTAPTPWRTGRAASRWTLTKLVLHGHDDLHLVQAVQAQVLHEVGGRLQLWSTEQSYSPVFSTFSIFT